MTHRRVTPAMQAAAAGFNRQAAHHARKALRRAWAIRRRQQAEALTAKRRARYHARLEREGRDAH